MSRIKVFLKLEDRFKTGKNRYAGKKAVIVNMFEEGTSDRPYGHCLVTGLAKYPKKVIYMDSAKKTDKKSRVKVFLKLEDRFKTGKNRYAGKKAVIVRVFEEGTRDRPYGNCLVASLDKYPKKVIRKDSTKKTAKKSCLKVFLKVEDRFKTGKNRWFFTKLRMIRHDTTCIIRHA
ncbi:60S ribosomal protein L27-3 [Hordeum vulgare]|nr:60S ribosomal protein L27-3 [Hordeum vulgare]